MSPEEEISREEEISQLKQRNIELHKEVCDFEGLLELERDKSTQLA